MNITDSGWDRINYECGAGNFKMEPSPEFMRYYGIVPSSPCSQLYQGTDHVVEAENALVELPDLFAMGCTLGIPSTLKTCQDHYDQSARCVDTDDLYPEWVEEIPGMRARIGSKVMYCVDPELYGSTILWYGLPMRERAMQRKIPIHMVGLVKLSGPNHNGSDLAWVVTLACGRTAKIGSGSMIQRGRSAEVLHRPSLADYQNRRKKIRTKRSGMEWCDSQFSSSQDEFVINLDGDRDLHTSRMPRTPEKAVRQNGSSGDHGKTAKKKEEIARFQNYRMYSLNVSGCKALNMQTCKPSPAKKQKRSAPSSGSGSGSRDPVPMDTSEPGSSVTSMECDPTLSWIESMVEPIFSKFKQTEDGKTPHGTFGSVLIPKERPKEYSAEECGRALRRFMVYWERYMRHLPEVRADPELGDAGLPPGGGTIAGIKADRDFNQAMRLYMEVVKTPVQ